MTPNTPEDLPSSEIPSEPSDLEKTKDSHREEIADILSQDPEKSAEKKFPLSIKGAAKAGMQIVKNYKGKFNFIPIDKEFSVKNVVSKKWFDRVGPFNEQDKCAIVSDIHDPKKFNLLRADGTLFFSEGEGVEKILPPAEGFRRVQKKKEDGTTEWISINTQTQEPLTDENNETVTFENISEFSDGFASFKHGEKRNYVDTKGNILLENDVDETRNFENGVAVVGNEGKFNYIDVTGKLLLPERIEATDSQEFVEKVQPPVSQEISEQQDIPVQSTQEITEEKKEKTSTSKHRESIEPKLTYEQQDTTSYVEPKQKNLFQRMWSGIRNFFS